MLIDRRNFCRDLNVRLPETCSLLGSANLVLHPRVSTVTLHGSRGLGGRPRPDSDIDLSLIIDTTGVTNPERLDALLRSVLETTLSHWQSQVELDLAAVFDIVGCGLTCFEREEYDTRLCPGAGVDCFGAYKIQKGFTGFVPKMGVRVERMYPCVVVWK